MPHDWKSDWQPEDDEEEFCNDEVEACPHCGEAIYDDSEQCPHCGTYLNASEEAAADSKPRGHPWLIVVGVLFCLVVFAIWIFGRNR
jgi:hypothetical protein